MSRSIIRRAIVAGTLFAAILAGWLILGAGHAIQVQAAGTSIKRSDVPTPTPTLDPSGALIQNGSFESGDLTGWQSSSTGGAVDPIINGNFENGRDGSWTEYSNRGLVLIQNTSTLPLTPHSGSWAVWLGGAPDHLSAITQGVTIPSGSSTLSFWYWIASEDVCGYDFGGVVINGTTVVDALNLCTTTNTGGWVKRTVDLSAYAGQTVALQIRAETDGSANSNFFVDDVSLGSTLLAMYASGGAPSSPAGEMDGVAEAQNDTRLAPEPTWPAGEVPNLLRAQPGVSGAPSGEQPLPETPGQPGRFGQGFGVPSVTGPQEEDGLRRPLLAPVTGLGAQAIPFVGVSAQESVDGDYAAYLYRPHGQLALDTLYQTIDVPAGVDRLVLNFWFGVATAERTIGNDWFCAGIADAADPDTILVDLGCIDAIDTAPYWQEVLYTFSAGELASIKGKSVDLTFYLFSDLDFYDVGAGSGSTTAWVDYVRAYATGGGGASSLDIHEPNDSSASATEITCGTVITGIIGDALGGYDVDWFKLTNVPTGRIDVDIDARTKSPPSALDSVVTLWNSSVSWLQQNDDDGASYDSYLVYTNTAGSATFYISVEPYGGNGSADSFYDLTVQCQGLGAGPPPPASGPVGDDDTWTVMLFLNAEDPNFASILTGYRTAIEAFIGAKSSFLTVVILYDGPGSDDTTRYVVQPNGAYTVGVNKWNLGELNMGAPGTLADFANWAMEQYPAEHYYLSVDDHGDGAYGISQDDHPSYGDLLEPPELYAALKAATLDGARKIDIFDYEACLMGLVENAYDVRQWVDYVVFFEQISWGVNTYPAYLADLAATDAPVDLGRRIVDRYHAAALQANGGRGYPHTISLIDTGQMAVLRDAVTSFASALQAAGNRDGIKSARNSSQAFAADIDATNPLRAEYIDLWDLAHNAGAGGLAPTQAAAVRSAVEAAVVHERHASGQVSGYEWDHSGAYGLSIYYPPAKSSSAFARYGDHYQMSHEGGWDEFLNWAVDAGIGRGMTSHRAEIKLTGGDAFASREVYLPLVIK